MVDGTPCDCREHGEVQLPYVLDIPSVYQGVEFSANLVPMFLPRTYGVELEEIIKQIKSKGAYNLNLLLCTPPNTGKTVFAYTIYRWQYMKGIVMPPIMDLIEAKDVMIGGNFNADMMVMRDKLFNSPVAIIKIPLDVPAKFAETISTILERRVRKGGVTFFLYGNTFNNLLAQDKYSVLKHLVRDGTYNSLKLLEYTGV